MAAEVYRKIRDEIASGRYEPDAVISEREWSRSLGAGSRTPLREALKALAGEGWIESLPRKGTRIVGLTRTDVIQIYEVRMELEGFGAFAAATRVDVEGLGALRRCVADLRHRLEEDDAPGFLDADLAIHRQVASMSSNPWLVRTIEFLAWSVKRLGQQSLMQPGRSRASMLEHESLLLSIESGDASAARVHLLRHLLNSRDYALRTMEAYRKPDDAGRGSPSSWDENENEGEGRHEEYVAAVP
ncbi:MAG: GntR family transcriptional regulator [Candidatus Limnocylindrales bacterium]